MKKRTKNIIKSSCLGALAVLFTILVKKYDVQSVGPNESNIGFAKINKFVFDTLGVSSSFDKLTDILLLLAIAIMGFYGLMGVYQLIKRKKIKKVDREIIALGVFYVVLAAIYVLFEKVVINYRPVLVEGELEASFPSSHTLLVICVCISSMIVNKRIFTNESLIDISSIALWTICIVATIGRLLSGMHWFTDIIGAIIISSTLLMIFYTILEIIKKKKKDAEE